MRGRGLIRALKPIWGAAEWPSSWHRLGRLEKSGFLLLSASPQRWGEAGQRADDLDRLDRGGLTRWPWRLSPRRQWGSRPAPICFCGVERGAAPPHWGGRARAFGAGATPSRGSEPVFFVRKVPQKIVSPLLAGAGAARGGRPRSATG